MWRTWTGRGLLLLLILAGVALRLAQLPFSAVWLDEAFSIRLAQMSLMDIVQVISRDNGSPLFYFLLHGWIRLFGTDEFVLTGLTVFLDCAALAAVPLFLKELFRDIRVQIAGTTCAAFCLPCLHQATNLRYYSLMVLCAVLGWLFFYRSMRLSRVRDWLMFVLISVAGFYTHIVYLFVLFAQGALLLLFHRDRLRTGIGYGALIAAGMLLWMPIVWLQISGYAGGSTPDTIPEISRYGGVTSAWLLSISSQMIALDSMKVIRLSIAAALIFFVLIWMFWKKSRAAGELLSAHLFSVGVLVLVSLFRPVFWLDKTDLIGLPLVCALTGFAFTRSRKMAPLLIAGLILFNLLGAARYTNWRMQGDLDGQRDAIAELSAIITREDAVVMTGISFHTAEYYLEQMGAQTGPRYVYPQVQRDRPSSIDEQQLRLSRDSLAEEAAVLMEHLEAVPGKIFVFHSDLPGLGSLYRYLERTFELVETIPVRGHPWGPVYSRIDIYCR